jgi:flavoprotein
MCSELLEDEYRRTGERADSHAAIGAYKLAGEAVASARPGQVPVWCTPYVCKSLGVALQREGEWNMAARAYRWAICHPRPREDLAVYRNTLATVLGNTLMLLEMCAWEKPSWIKRSDKLNTKEQSAVFLPTDHECAMCGKELTSKEAKKCKSCSIATYCSRDCQVAHWGAHKKACKLARSW